MAKMFQQIIGPHQVMISLQGGLLTVEEKITSIKTSETANHSFSK